MKAFLLAAGLGTRLQPITLTTPKCLVPIKGRPLLSWWLDLLARHDVSDVLINLHHHPDAVRRFAADYSGPIRLTLVMEDHLLGSGGTLHANREFVGDDAQFYILYADNLTNVDLGALRQFNSDHPAPLTVGLFRAENPRACGIAELDASGRIVDFTEKPEQPRSNLASAGMFVARPELFEYLHPVSSPYDFGSQVMPRLVGKMNGLPVSGYMRDIGTLESLRKAEEEVSGW